MTIGEMIKRYRLDMGMSQREFALKSGISNVSIAAYEKNMNPKTGRPYKLSYETYARLAAAMGMDIDEMFEQLGDDAEVTTLPNGIKSIKDILGHRVPVLGEVAAGQPILAVEDIEDYVYAPEKADCALIIRGESMLPTYEPGDIIYIREQPTIDYQGQVAVVLLDDEATVKHVYSQPDGLMLVSDNPNYPPMFKSFKDFSNVRIFGKVCGFTRMYRGC